MKKNTTSSEKFPQPSSFEEGMGQLGDIVSKLESGILGLSDSITAYENGVTLIRHLHEELSDAEERISQLIEIDDNGKPTLKPFVRAKTPTTASGGSKKTKKRSVKKQKRPNVLPGMDDEEKDA
tara:strand:+ start:151 stop:522 length:372 start_codon:yes stop_codon:yes gene_type:complete